MHRYLNVLLLSAALFAPVAVRADDHNANKRYYDKSGKDWHEWNDNEQRAYSQYQGEQHHQIEFGKSNKSQQGAYFKWRHTHPDSVIISVK